MAVQTIEIIKTIIPSADPGLFNLQIDGVTKGANLGNGGTTGGVSVSVGAHTVGEIAGTGTNLAYYSSVIGGDASPGGAITVGPSEQKVVTITNTLLAPAYIVVNKVLSPSYYPGKFNLLIDGVVVATDVVDGGTSGPIAVAPGAHTITETAGTGTNPLAYTVAYGGDASSVGVVTAVAGATKTVTVTNTPVGPGNMPISVTGGAVIPYAGGATGLLYEMKLDFHDDAGDELRWLRSAPVISAEGAFIFHRQLLLDMQMGVGNTVAPGDDPQVCMQSSDDGGYIWTSEKWVSAGRIGEYLKRAVWRRLGRSRNRCYRIFGSDPVKTALVDCYLETER